MKYYLVEGIITNPEKMSNNLLEEHKKYIQKAMDNGLILISSLKSDMSSSITIIKSSSDECINEFYNNEPFFKQGVLKYNISEIEIHYHNSDIEGWFK